MHFDNLKMLVQGSSKSMDEPNKTHLGAIFGLGHELAAPVYVFVSLTWCLSHFICSRAVISFLTPVCIFRAQDSDQFTARVNKYLLKWIISSRSGPVCHCSLLVFVGGPTGDSSPILVARRWGEGIFWQLIIILGVFCLRVLVCWVFELGAKRHLGDNVFMNVYWEWYMISALRWFYWEMCGLTNKKKWMSFRYTF